MKASHCGLWGGRECGSHSVNFLLFLLLSFPLPFLLSFFLSFLPSFFPSLSFSLPCSLPTSSPSISLFPSISSKGSWFLTSFQEYQQVYIKWLAILLGFVFIFLFSIQFWALGDNLYIFNCFIWNCSITDIICWETLFLMQSYLKDKIFYSKIFSIFRPLKSLIILCHTKLQRNIYQFSYFLRGLQYIFKNLSQRKMLYKCQVVLKFKYFFLSPLSFPTFSSTDR